jgi:hypothetical protein
LYFIAPIINVLPINQIVRGAIHRITIDPGALPWAIDISPLRAFQELAFYFGSAIKQFIN